ncbi:hypothetical protein METESE_11980 [Mesoterricola sediminis]|uniref:DNA (cytosine-5-)-methyltransferase n=2 Tax=Mesoterricola sediminis TaxID=2927980 RepID=A0AA48GV75_9BACT|nr:hypothetical protein METESE_11980 [Mesoterricola sediminis]
MKGGLTRMMNVQETLGAMGFPSDYRLSGKHKEDINLLGNAVCPPKVRWLLRHVMEQVA